MLVKPSGRHGLSFAFDIIPTGLEYLAAYIRNDVKEIRIIDLEMEQQPPQLAMQRHLDEFKPDLVGISMCSTEHKEGLELAKMSKIAGAIVVMGGFHPTAIPDELLSNDCVDYVIRREGEQTFKELVQKSAGPGILGLSYKDKNGIVHNPDRPFIEDLDSIPFPARDLRRYKYRNTLIGSRIYDVLTTSRGCWGRCSFCCEPSMSESVQRYRSPENVMSEIREIVSFHDGKPLGLEITDPHFMGKPEIVEKLCDMLEEAAFDIEFIAKVRPDSMAKHPDIVRKMVQVGISAYEMGIESPNMRDLKSTSKGIKTEMHRQAVENITKWGGTAGGTFVIGLPDQTEEEILQFPGYAKEIGLTSSAFGIATPYPSTKFYNDLDEEGLIFEEDWTRFDEMHSVFKTKNLDSKRIEELASICMAKFWSMDRFFEKERINQIRRPGKPSIIQFIADRIEDMRFSVSSLEQLQDDNTVVHAIRFFEASPDPSVRQYTEKIGIHNIVEMNRFLRIAGRQTIQLTVTNNGKPVVSWILKTSSGQFEYIDVVKGSLSSSSINLAIDINDMKFGRNAQTRKEKISLLLKILGTNKGISRQVNFFRVALAGGVEALSYIRKRNGNAWKNGNGNGKGADLKGNNGNNGKNGPQNANVHSHAGENN